jgi:hypothetical protein
MLRRPAPAVAFLLALAIFPVPARAQADDLKALQALFEKEPAAGFGQAARMLAEPQRKADIDSTMAVGAVVAEQSLRCRYGGVLEAMIDNVQPVARGERSLVELGAVVA